MSDHLGSTFVLPVLPLKNTVVFPQMAMPAMTDRSVAIAAIEAALVKEDKTVVALTQRNTTTDTPKPADLYRVGTTAMVKVLSRSDKVVQAILLGMDRVEVVDFEETTPYLTARVRPMTLSQEKGIEVDALQSEIMDLTNTYFALGHPELHLALPTLLSENEDIMRLLYALGQLFAHDIIKSQALLEASTRVEAMKLMRGMLQHEIKVLQLRQKIAQQTQKKLSREQHDYILRQQLLTIQQELGEKNPTEREITELRKRSQEKQLPEEVRNEVERELSRLEHTPAAAQEYQLLLNYLELVFELPWDKGTVDILSLKNSRQVLDEDHYDLKEVKERIIEQLAVMKLNPDAKAPILCFVGPPGVGKTSVGQSIARALGRKFERFSLGGLHDEAELRGHRRTYIGAMPGRIIQAIRRAGVNNPLLMLDEVDKLGKDFRGDPAAALTEVLDPAQNFSFRDNYLNLPFDLSKVFFITTANTVDTIPKPLLDRMETIRLSGYSDEEKLEIARRYLLPRQRKEAGLDEHDFTVPDETIMTIIKRYTREAGLRELERKLGRLARKVAVRFAEHYTDPVTVQREDLAEMLGPENFFVEHLRKKLPAGVATGLAWTEAGGDVLYVEAIALPEGQKFTLTGQLGEVMKESAMAANSYLLSHGDALGIKQFNAPVHIHVPAGATPKDGPSAGVTMAAALASLYSGWPVRSDTAMTGEITLSGLVLPVGGIKEKILAARRAGIRRIVLPNENKKNLCDLPPHVTEEMEFVFVESIIDVLQAVLPLQAVKKT